MIIIIYIILNISGLYHCRIVYSFSSFTKRLAMEFFISWTLWMRDSRVCSSCFSSFWNKNKRKYKIISSKHSKLLVKRTTVILPAWLNNRKRRLLFIFWTHAQFCSNQIPPFFLPTKKETNLFFVIFWIIRQIFSQ